MMAHAVSFENESNEFRREQLSALVKSLDSSENPIKEKHLRIILIGTFREEGGASLFWSHIQSHVSVFTDDIITWKFCILLHKILNEGHQNFVFETDNGFLGQLKGFWESSGASYASHITLYLKLLTSKINLHQNQRILPSNFEIKGLSSIDPSFSFEVSAIIFDYLEELIEFMSFVLIKFDALKVPSLSSSLRLSCLVPSIIEAGKLIELLRQMMSILNCSLSSESLEGHRNRFCLLYERVRLVFDRCSSLTYFHGLLTIPKYSKNPPLFFNSKNPSPNSSLPISYGTPMNGIQKESLRDDKVNRLESRISDLISCIDRLKMENTELQALNKALQELSRRNDESMRNEREEYNASLAKYHINIEYYSEELSREKDKNGKLEKLKEAYSKLRQEHIDVLRSKGNSDKILLSLSNQLDESEQLKNGLRAFLSNISSSTTTSKDLYNNNNVDSNELLVFLTRQISDFEREIKGKNEEISSQELRELDLKNKMMVLDRKNIDNSSQISELLIQISKYKEDAEFKAQKESEKLFQRNEFIQEWKNLLRDTSNNSQSQLNSSTILSLLNSVDGEKHLLALTAISLLYNKHRGTVFQFLSGEKSLEDLKLCLQDDDDEKEEEEEDISSLVKAELSFMEDSIAVAAEKMNKLLLETAKKDSGIKLEYNTKILDSCSNLIDAILELIQISKHLQQEITKSASETVNLNDFYKKNIRWTEGLISGAKAVGMGANVLLKAANDVVNHEGSFEAIIAASQEIASSTAQIVIASKVKALPSSENLIQLRQKSKVVTEVTAQVIAFCTTYSRISTEEQIDFTTLTPHQSKYLEMECQVKLLALESEVERERNKLFQYRKNHYQ